MVFVVLDLLLKELVLPLPDGEHVVHLESDVNLVLLVLLVLVLNQLDLSHLCRVVLSASQVRYPSEASQLVLETGSHLVLQILNGPPVSDHRLHEDLVVGRASLCFVHESLHQRSHFLSFR